LEKGYWFYGEETVALSFWTGIDYTNKRSAISFLINPNEYCRLIIQTDIYQNFHDYLITQTPRLEYLGIQQKNNFFTKEYSKFSPIEYLTCLSDFIKNDLTAINMLVEEYNSEYKSSFEFNDSNIDHFSSDEFIYRINNIFRYRQHESPELTMYSLEDERKADVLTNISIEDYGFIKKETLDFGENSNWVFITGQNGSGKTMLLRAIATALGNRTLSSKELTKNKSFKIDANFRTDRRIIPFQRKRNEGVKAKRSTIARGLAMYGPYRLAQTSNSVQDKTFRKALSKIESFNSLFEEESKLLSLDKQLELWSKNKLRKNSIV
jgi:hypothetical protein